VILSTLLLARTGDVGVIVEHYPASVNVPDGCELEVFCATGQTIAMVRLRRPPFVRRRSTRS